MPKSPSRMGEMPRDSEDELARPVSSGHYADASTAREYADELSGLDGPSRGELDADEQFPYYRIGSWDDPEGQGAPPAPSKADSAGDKQYTAKPKY